ncbi:putative ribonuclease H-like domain-containing protein [Tanacetum coccineum]
MPEPVVNEPNVVSQPKVWSDAPIIEEYESDSEDEHGDSTHKMNKKYLDYPHRALQNKGIVDSGCSKHMTRNKAYLAEYQDFNGGPVAFGGSKGYITGKGKIKTGKLDFEDVCFVKELQHFNLFSVSQICDKKNKVLFTDSECLVLSPEFKLPDENQVLLRIPRQNNMYSFNLENIVPSGGLACLIAKATIDESNKWHRRLGHVNFKNLNKLVKGNLVRGLPSKIFQNDHTCVACQKGKQHKASCKAKTVSSISQPLQLLHMDLFGPTSVRSLNHKTLYLLHTASTPVSTASPYGGLSFTDLTNTDQDDSEIPTLEEIYDNPTAGIFSNASYGDEVAVADFTNLETVVNVNPKTSHLSAVKKSISDYDGANLDRKSIIGEQNMLSAVQNCCGQSFYGSKGKVTPLFPNMLVQPIEDEGEGSERPSEPQPIPSPPHPKVLGGKSWRTVMPVINPFYGYEGHDLQSVDHKLFMSVDDDEIDYMETKDAQDVGRTRYVVHEEKESAEKEVSTKDALNTDQPKVSTDRPDEGTVDQTEGSSATLTTPIPTPTIFVDDETIAQVLLNMSQAKAVSIEKEKGVELKDVENIKRPRPTSTRSLLTLKPLPKIDPKDKGKKKIEEDESDTESEDINESEKKFKMLAHDDSKFILLKFLEDVSKHFVKS